MRGESKLHDSRPEREPHGPDKIEKLGPANGHRSFRIPSAVRIRNFYLCATTARVAFEYFPRLVFASYFGLWIFRLLFQSSHYFVLGKQSIRQGIELELNHTSCDSVLVHDRNSYVIHLLLSPRSSGVLSIPSARSQANDLPLYCSASPADDQRFLQRPP